MDYPGHNHHGDIEPSSFRYVESAISKSATKVYLPLHLLGSPGLQNTPLLWIDRLLGSQ